MRLPNATRARVDPERLRRYVLNPQHEEGKHKARVFRSVFGLDLESTEELRTALVNAASSGEAIETRTDEYGQRYRIDFELERGGRRGVIRSAWFIPAQSGDPRLLSCWVLVESVRDV